MGRGQEKCDGCQRQSWRCQAMVSSRTNTAGKICEILCRYFKDIPDAVTKVQGLRLCTPCLKHVEFVAIIERNVKGDELVAATPEKRCSKRQASTPLKYRTTPQKDVPAKVMVFSPGGALSPVPKFTASTSRKKLFLQDHSKPVSEEVRSPGLVSLTSTVPKVSAISLVSSEKVGLPRPPPPVNVTVTTSTPTSTVITLPSPLTARMQLQGGMVASSDVAPPRPPPPIQVTVAPMSSTQTPASGEAELDNVGFESCGVYFRSSEDTIIHDQEKVLLLSAISAPDVTYQTVMRHLGQMSGFRQPMMEAVCKLLEMELASMTARPRQSVLGDKTLEALESGDIISRVTEEMCERCPNLVDVLVTLGCGPKIPDTKKLAGPFTLIYAVLLNLRNYTFDGFQRVMTLVLAHGRITERCLTTLNQLHICTSYKTKLKILDQCGQHNDQKLRQELKDGAVPTLVGDNFDITLRPRYQSRSTQPKECHYYATMIHYSRIPDRIQQLRDDPEGNVAGDCDPTVQVPSNFWRLTDEERAVLKSSYRVFIARILAKTMPEMEFLDTLYPAHIPHLYSDEMKKKSTIRGLNMIFKDEKKTENCVQILDETTEQLGEYLDEVLHSIPYHGDQLTRERLTWAKLLRRMAKNLRSKFAKIGPFLITLWHTKQDFLEKAYKALWHASNVRDVTTLRRAAAYCKMKNVNGEVKTNYRAHEHLMLTVGELLIAEQAMEHLGMTDAASWPAALPLNIKSLPKKWQREAVDEMIDTIIDKYGYVSSLPGMNDPVNPPPEELLAEETILRTLPDGRLVKGVVKNPPPKDEIMEYGQELTKRALVLMMLNDMAREADLDRSIVAVKMLIPWFYAHSGARSKYFHECVDFVLKTTILGTPADRLRLLEGAFCNMRGGAGGNHEVDLVMENRIKEAKTVTRACGSQQTERAILRATSAAATVTATAVNFQQSLGVWQRSGRHKDASDDDRQALLAKYRKARPFKFVSGRELGGRGAKKRFDEIDPKALKKSVKKSVITRLRRSMVDVDEDAVPRKDGEAEREGDEEEGEDSEDEVETEEEEDSDEEDYDYVYFGTDY